MKYSLVIWKPEYKIKLKIRDLSSAEERDEILKRYNSIQHFIMTLLFSGK